MRSKDLREEYRIADVRQWEVADTIGISDSPKLSLGKMPVKKNKGNMQALIMKLLNGLVMGMGKQFLI